MSLALAWGGWGGDARGYIPQAGADTTSEQHLPPRPCRLEAKAWDPVGLALHRCQVAKTTEHSELHRRKFCRVLPVESHRG